MHFHGSETAPKNPGKQTETRERERERERENEEQQESCRGTTEVTCCQIGMGAD